MAEWQDIGTARKDGSLVDLWMIYGERVPDAKWDPKRGWVEWTIDDFDRMDWCRISGEPTHWMDVPAPPAVAKE